MGLSLRELWGLVRAQDLLFEALSGPPSKLKKHRPKPSSVTRERHANSVRCFETLKQHGLRLAP